MNDSFQTWLAGEIVEMLARQTSPPPFVVWCDPDRSWLDLLRVSSNVSGFELWAPEPKEADIHELVLRDRMFHEERRPRIVWLPTSRHDLTWFKVFEIEAEEIWETTLLDAIRSYGVQIPFEHEQELIGLLPAHAREWFDKPKSTWRELTPGNAKGALVDDGRMLEVLAGNDGEFERLVRENRFEVFARRATEDYGLPNPAGVSEKNWRIESLSYLLCTEAAEAYAVEPPSEPNKIVAPGLPRKRSLDLLRSWQNHVHYITTFETMVPKADATVGLTYWARNLSSPPRSRASRAVEKVLFEEAAAKFDRIENVDLLTDELEKSLQVFKERERGFWESQAREKIGWRFLTELADAAGLVKECRDVEKRWSTIRDAFDWYTLAGWKLDWAGEQLFKERPDLPTVLNRIRLRLRRGYLRSLDRIGRTFSELLASDTESLASIPTAGEQLLKELESSTVATAVFFLDACRFDIGYRLCDLINEGEPETRARIEGAIAPIPSVTALGMAYALPIERNRFKVTVATDGKLCIHTANFDGDLKWAKERRRWLKESYGCKDWFEIADIFDADKLKKATKVRKLIAIHGDELDSHDGQLELTGVDAHLKRYVQAVRRVRDAGYNRVIIVSDHGFFHWQPDEHEIEETLPVGQIEWKHRRAMVGRNLSHPTAVILPVAQSDLEVAIPRSTSAFRTYGALGFFHGGATLQELAIPVIVANWPIKVRKIDVVLKPVGYISSETPRLQVQAAGTGQLLLLGPDSDLIPRSVIVKVVEQETGKLVFRHTDSVLVRPEGPPLTVQLNIIEPRPDLPFGTKLSVIVIDADDEEILAREEVPLKTEINDW